MIYPSHCDGHAKYTAGCRPCRDAMARHCRQQADVLPDAPLRSEADDAYVRGLIDEVDEAFALVDEVDEAIAMEMRVGYLARRCTEYLTRRAMGIESSW